MVKYNSPNENQLKIFADKFISLGSKQKFSLLLSNAVRINPSSQRLLIQILIIVDSML